MRKKLKSKASSKCVGCVYVAEVQLADGTWVILSKPNGGQAISEFPGDVYSFVACERFRPARLVKFVRFEDDTTGRNPAP